MILTKSISFINPKSSSEFNQFIKGKKFVIIDGLGNSFSEMKVRYLLNQENINQIMISNVGNIQGSEKPSILRYLSYYFFKKYPI